jgi:hypothetical protein
MCSLQKIPVYVIDREKRLISALIEEIALHSKYNLNWKRNQVVCSPDASSLRISLSGHGRSAAADTTERLAQ